MRVKEQSEKAALKLSIQKTKIMAFGFITSWQIEWGKVEAMIDFFLGSKITADGDCSRGIKRCLLLGRKAMINLESLLKSRDITLPTEVHVVKAVAFPVVMYGYESWTIKKIEHRRMMLFYFFFRIDAFELWCWRRLLSPLDFKEIKPVNPKGNQSWIFIGKNDAEAPILWPPDAKSRVFGKHPDARDDWSQKDKGATEDEMVR